MQRAPFLKLTQPLLLLCLLGAWTASAASEQLATQLWTEPSIKRAERRQLAALLKRVSGELTSLHVRPLGPSLEPRRCAADVECFRALARDAQTDHLLVLDVTGHAGDFLDLALIWVDTARQGVVRRSPKGVARSTLEETLRRELMAIIPPFARKGWGGLSMDPALVRVRVDGRALPATTRVIPLVAGTHELDVQLSSGTSVLSRQEVVEGSCLHLSAAMPAYPASASTQRSPVLRRVAFALFSAGALGLASSLVAGGLAQSKVRGLDACQSAADTRCATYAEARSAQHSAEKLARVGDVLLLSGAGLSLAGAGLFVFDLLPTREGR